MRLNTHIIIRILTVILLLTGVSGGGNLAYAWSGSGTSSDPYLIGSKADWNEFINRLGASFSNKFNGEYLKLTADIDVGGDITPAGDNGVNRDFKGTFDGNGHTLNVNCSGTGRFIALFRGTYGATIKNLRVVGSIHNTATSSSNNDHENKFTAGLVGHCQAGTVIQNCVISVTIISDISGDGSHGGIVGWINNATSEANRVRIENCLFNGKLLGENTYNCGGFVGAGANDNQRCEISHCLFSPSEITMSPSGSDTFSRCSNTTTPYSCYTIAFGTTPGDYPPTNANLIADNLNSSNPVSGNTWEVNEGGNVAYLSTFNKKVDITGWISGSTAGTSSSNPYLDIFGGNGVTYEYKDYTAADGTYITTPPTSAGHYYVRATDPFGFRNIKDFYVYDPPTPNKSLIYNGTDQDLLTVPNIEKGSYMFKVDAGWGPSTPKGQAARTYTINYYIRSSESNYKDIGSKESPIGSFEVTIAPKSLGSEAIVLGESTYIYDGTEKKPSVTVKDGNTTINSDFYNVSYSNHINAGTATVTVTDKDGGNYVVNGTKEFTITPKTVSNPTITLSETSYVYDDNPKTPSVTVKDGNNVIPPSEYSVTYSNNKNAGTATVTVKDNENGNYTVSGSTTFSITPEQLTVTVTANDLYYNYEEQNLVTGSLSGSGSLGGCHIYYSLDDTNYSTNVPKGKEAKTYTVYYHVLADGNHMNQSKKTVNVTIKGKKVDTPTIQISPSTFTYDRNPKTPDVTVYDGNYLISSSEYTVSYSNNTNAGTTATVTVTDIEGGNYVVNGTKTFTINPKEVSSPTVEIPATTYTGSPLKPTVTVKDGDTVIDPSEYTVSYSNNVNVEDVPVVTITDKDGGNYAVNGTGTFQIVKAAPTYTAPAAKDLTYNMNVQELINPGSTNHGTFEYSTDGTNFTTSTTGLVGTDAKDYLIYYRLIGDSNHNDVGNAPAAPLTLTVTIKPKPVSSPEILISPDVYNYDGTAKQPTVTVRDGGTVIPTTEYSVIYENNTNAGTATVNLQDNPDGNYTVSGSKNFSIIAQAPTVTPPTPISGLTYNTNMQNLVLVGTAVGGTMEYSLDGTNYSIAIPQGQDAKQYAVYYRVKGDGNHTDRESVLIYVTISPKTVSAPAINLDPASFTYDGTEKKPAVTVKDGNTVIPASEYAVDYSNNVNVGTGSVVISDNTGGNYIVSGSTTFAILAAGSGITPPVAKTDLVYNSEAQVLVTAGSATGGTMYYGLSRSSYSTEVPTGKDAKTYTVYYKVIGDSNHEDTEVGSVDVTIAPKTLSTPEIILTPSTFTYDGTAKEPSVMVKDGETIVPAAEYTIEYSDNTAAGSGVVTLKDNEGGNYIVGGSATFTISGADPGVTPPTAKTGLVYNTQLQPLVTAGIVVGGVMEYSLDGTNYSDDIPQGKDAQQYEVFYRVKGDENHGNKEAASLMATISAKTLTSPTIILGTTSYVFDGKEKEPGVTVKDGEVVVAASEYTVEYSDNINVGTAKAIVRDKEGGNYIVNGTKDFTIVNANADITPPTAKGDLVYNGAEQQLVTAGSVKGGSMEYSLDNTTFTTEIPTGMNAKDYKVYYRVKGDPNYSDESATALTVTISPKTLTEPNIILTPSSFIFDGKEKTPTVTVKDGEMVIEASEYTVTFTDNTSAGVATVTITDKEGGNYIISGTNYFSIFSAVAGVTFPEVKSGLVYNGAEQELVTAGSAKGGTMEYSLDNKKYDTKIPTGTNAKQYTVYFKVVGDDNHESMEAQSMIVTISPKSIDAPVIELSETIYTYDGTAKEPDVTVKDGERVIDPSEYGKTYSDNTNVGTAKVTITDKEGGNYVVNGTQTFNIVAAGTGVIPPTARTGLVYNGRVQNLIVGGSAEGGTMKYSLDKNVFTTDIPTGIDAKQYTVYYRVDGDENHSDSDSGSVDVTISPKTVNEPSIILEPANFIYDGAEKTPTVTINDGETVIPASEYTVTYSNNTEAGVGIVTITDNNGGNYSVNGTANFSIISAVAGVTLPEAISGLVYNGAKQELVKAGSSVGGTMEYSTDGKSFSTKIPTGIDAKQYTVYFRILGDDNHASVDPVSMIARISAKTVSNPVVELSPSVVVYNGKEQEPTVTLKDEDIGTEIPASEYIVSYSNNINIGTANITITDNPGGNYSVNMTTTFTIYDPNIGFKAPRPISGLVYNGKAQDLLVAGTATEGVLQYSLDGKTYSTAIPEGTNAATYTVWYRVLDPTGNVKKGPETFSVTISPKSILISATFTGLSTQSIPALTVVDEQDNALLKDDYIVTYKDSQGMEVTPTNGQLPEGDYEIIVRPTGNYSGLSISTTFHVRGALSFVFTIQSDLVTVCLPYGRAVPDDYEVYYFDRVEDDGTPLFKRILLKQLKAGEPYILHYVGTSAGTRASRQLDLSPSNPALVDLSTPIAQMMIGGYVFTGIYDDMTNQKGVAEGAYILQADNTWQATASSKPADASKVYLEAFHAYLRHRDRSTDSPTINVKMSPSTTAINGIILEDEDGEQMWYDLNGRRIDHPQKGVNILRTSTGKTRKVVIR